MGAPKPAAAPDMSKVQQLVKFVKALPRDQLAAAYQATDTNGSGGVSVAELKGIVSQALPEVQFSDADLTAAIDLADLNKDGEVSFDELVTALDAVPDAPKPAAAPDMSKVQQLVKSVKALPRDQLAAAYQATDTNGSGGVSVAELKVIMSQALPEVQFSDADLTA